MSLKLYMVHIIGGPALLKEFDISKQDTEECFFSNNFAIFSSEADIEYWEEFFETRNADFSYIVVDITDNASPKKLRGYFDVKMKNGEGLLRLIKSFSGEEEKVLKLTEEEEEERLDVILSKISKQGQGSLNDEEREFLENYKK